MQFVKMVQFTRLVKIDGQLREFNFRKLRDTAEKVFSVNVCHGLSDRLYFNMQKKEDGWKIISDQLPAWILHSEKILNDVLEDELVNW